MELGDDDYHVVGSKADAKREDRVGAISEILPDEPPGLTAEEIIERWPADGEISKPGLRTVRKDLDAIGWPYSGSGTKGDPKRFYGRNPIPARRGSWDAGLKSKHLGAPKKRATLAGSRIAHFCAP